MKERIIYQTGERTGDLIKERKGRKNGIKGKKGYNIKKKKEQET